MANPITVACAYKTWTKVADSVETGIIKRVYDSQDIDFYETYRIEDDPAPSALTDASLWGRNEDLIINSNEPIDVYLYAVNGAGNVKVES